MLRQTEKAQHFSMKYCTGGPISVTSKLKWQAQRNTNNNKSSHWSQRHYFVRKPLFVNTPPRRMDNQANHQQNSNKCSTSNYTLACYNPQREDGTSSDLSHASYAGIIWSVGGTSSACCCVCMSRVSGSLVSLSSDCVPRCAGCHTSLLRCSIYTLKAPLL